MDINEFKYKVFASHFLQGNRLEDELTAGFFTHLNDPSYLKEDEILERCTITILISGKAIYKDNFLPKFNLKPGMIILRPKGSVYSIRRDVESGDYLEYVINLPDDFSSIFYSSNMLPQESKVYKLTLDEYFLQRCVTLSESLKYTNNNYLGGYVLALTDFFDYIYHKVNHKPEDKDAKLLSTACRMLQTNLHYIIDFKELSRQLGVSQRKLRYLFAQKLNTSPKKYRLKYKFMTAENLLVNSKISVKEIAASLGYSNPQNFSRQFHKFYNMSPEDLRKKLVHKS